MHSTSCLQSKEIVKGACEAEVNSAPATTTGKANILYYSLDNKQIKTHHIINQRKQTIMSQFAISSLHKIFPYLSYCFYFPYYFTLLTVYFISLLNKSV